MPLSVDSATKARNTGRLSAFSPVMPKAASAARSMLGSGVGATVSAANACSWATVAAKASILATVVTSLTFRLPMASFSKARPEVLRPAAVVAPIAL